MSEPASAPAPIPSSHERVTLGLLAPLTLVAAVALAAVALADGASRSGETWGPLVYWTALAVCAVPFAFRLAGSRAFRVERIGLVVIFGFFLYGLKILRDPTGFTYADELVHAYNVDSIVSTHSLFDPNADPRRHAALSRPRDGDCRSAARRRPVDLRVGPDHRRVGATPDDGHALPVVRAGVGVELASRGSPRSSTRRARTSSSSSARSPTSRSPCHSRFSPDTRSSAG